MKDPVDRAMQRAQQYWYRDGLFELGAAVIFAVLGIYFYLTATLPEGSGLKSLLESSFVLLIVGGSFLGGWMLRMLKQRITYPRTGYVSYRKRTGKYQWILVIFTMIVSGITAAMLINAPGSLDMMPAATGVILGIILIFFSFRGGAVRFFILGLLSILVGLGLSMAGFGNQLGLSYYYFIVCIVLLLSGATALLNYLRTTEPPSVEPQ